MNTALSLLLSSHLTVTTTIGAETTTKTDINDADGEGKVIDLRQRADNSDGED